MQVNNIAVKEQDNPNVASKNQQQQTNGYFLSFLKDVEVQINTDASSIVNKKPSEPVVKEDNYSEKTQPNQQSDSKDNKKEEKVEAETNSTDDKQASAREDAKKDVDEDAPVVHETKSDNTEKAPKSNKSEVLVDSTKQTKASAQSSQTSVQTEAPVVNNEVGVAGSNEVKTKVPEGSAVEATTQSNIKTMTVTSDVENIAGPFSLPKTKIVMEDVDQNAKANSADIMLKADSKADTSDKTVETFKSLVDGKGLAPEGENLVVGNDKAKIAQQTKTTEVNPQIAKIDYSQNPEALEQAKLFENIIGQKKTPTKISVDVINTQTDTAPIALVSDAVASLNISHEGKNVNSQSSLKVASKKININPEITQETTDRFSTSFSNVVKMAKEQILGGSQEASQGKEVKAEISEVGLGLSTKEQTTSKNISSDSEFLLLNKTYNHGKSVGVKNAAPVKTEQATPKQVIDQIKVQIKQSNASDKITVKLNPKELGQVELKVEVSKSGSMNVEITANKKETLELLKQDIKYLEKALQETVAKNESTPTFSFNLKGENQNQGEGSNNFAGRQGNQNNQNESETLNENKTEEVKKEEYRRSGISIKV